MAGEPGFSASVSAPFPGLTGTTVQSALCTSHVIQIRARRQARRKVFAEPLQRPYLINCKGSELEEVYGEAPHVLPHVRRVFLLMKRWAMGVYHGLRPKHLEINLQEFVFRFNRRRHYRSAFDTLLGIGMQIGARSYWDITGKWPYFRDLKEFVRAYPEHREDAYREAIMAGVEKRFALRLLEPDSSPRPADLRQEEASAPAPREAENRVRLRHPLMGVTASGRTYPLRPAGDLRALRMARKHPSAWHAGRRRSPLRPWSPGRSVPTDL